MLRRVGRLALLVEGAFVVSLLFFPIYIEPGAGSIGCGRLWRPAQLEQVLQEPCYRALLARQGQLTGTLVLMLFTLAICFCAGQSNHNQTRA